MNTFKKVAYWQSAVVLSVAIYAAITIYRSAAREHTDEANDTTDTDSEYYTAEEGNEPDSDSDTSDTEYYTAEEGDEPDTVSEPAPVNEPDAVDKTQMKSTSLQM
ncbi:hypothetical protein QBC46DRAFT_402950 [Diplogelasinospora grovesii]|uniref:Uncharacterized protein n=1 Tax=Diplogelasinospora grovesii TaxID=303347 RepID=A0AAN6NJC0_9PEZI|nr:hypothetical protein QBC46DRAFT_402950 [Diplogelasinospora grovesii]